MSLFSPLSSAVTGGSWSGRSGASLILSGSGRSGASLILSAGNGADLLASDSNAAASIQNIIDGAKVDAQRQQMMRSVSLRIQAIALGRIEPKAVWEKVAGYLTATGQPFTYTITDKAKVEIHAQVLQPVTVTDSGKVEEAQTARPGRRDDMVRALQLTVTDTGEVETHEIRPPRREAAMRQALQRLDDIHEKVDALATKRTLRKRLIDAVDRIKEMDLYNGPAEEEWERDFQVIKSTGRPVLVGLDPDGHLRAIDQLESDFDYVEDPYKRLKLMVAAVQLHSMLKEKSALERAGERRREKKSDYTSVMHTLKSTNKDLYDIMKKNEKNLPDIMKKKNDNMEVWQKEVIEFWKNGDDYFLDVDENNKIVARRNKDTRRMSTAQRWLQESKVGNKKKEHMSAAEVWFVEHVGVDYYVIPEFLKESRADAPTFNERWEETAMDKMKNKTPFHLALIGDRVYVRETTFVSAFTAELLKPKSTSDLEKAMDIINQKKTPKRGGVRATVLDILS